MDDALIKRMDEIAGKPASVGEHAVKISHVDDVKGEIALVFGDQEERYALKPLNELYGGGNSGTVDPQNETYMPLFLCIEEEIARFDAMDGRLNDGTVTLALNRLSMSPDEPTEDPLIRRIQFGLRMNLSLNNYSRQEVRQAIRKIGKSAERHSEGGRGRGYLNFIEEFFGKLRK